MICTKQYINRTSLKNVFREYVFNSRFKKINIVPEPMQLSLTFANDVPVFASFPLAAKQKKFTHLVVSLKIVVLSASYSNVRKVPCTHFSASGG